VVEVLQNCGPPAITLFYLLLHHCMCRLCAVCIKNFAHCLASFFCYLST